MQQKLWWLLALSFSGTSGAMDQRSAALVKYGVEFLRARRVPLAQLQRAEENARVIRERLALIRQRRPEPVRISPFDLALYLRRGGTYARL
ncbi:MAG TPA: hypothetical protein VJJ83_03360 [Candidatus Babeliales bacterium]|nr:hypothetical protein [Candidatus Babeliales bacterium]